KKIAEQIFDNHAKLEHARMVHGRILCGGRCVDDVMAVYFAAPRSYTGEDSIEIHCHASAPGVYEIIRCIMSAGARPAQPGEFTRRAFLNGKMDLSQAEAVCDFIAAASDAGARAAQFQLQGGMKDRVLGFQDRLSDLLAEAQAAVEYPEEDLETGIAQTAAPSLEELLGEITALAGTFCAGSVIKNGILTAIAGKPNVGKSSLLNALAGRERAIVAQIPGTTRDTVEHAVSIGGVAFNLTDTAGIRAAGDEVERMGVARSKDALSAAQLTLFVLDASAPLDRDDLEAFSHVGGRAILVLNKADLAPAMTGEDARRALGDLPSAAVSARTGEGLGALRDAMAAFAGTDARAAEDLLVTSARHKCLLDSAAGHIRDALSALRTGVDMDCVTIDLQSAWDDLGAITGNTLSEEIIDRIFEKFCLGK
ncbi:MAG: tRNA uridine-5-carboxymethylaminomethyl(34) synthesis GTPase MnmE, partial [Clostridiales bacterium]|nr:tRNA uridine-5-carboxymethylaminomethyl(34) synthesis GTPase MnmE [Clostridiales bacterium]